ncbi:hypothetical protein IMCC26207_105225 [Actinobacteria bacterium IMCC26207]|nr:hypothetical protein IMCC26207_105225 [Actinobacteria bacterium IMCC26207]
MPVPLPASGELMPPPEPDEVMIMARAVVTAVSGHDGLTDLQHSIIIADFAAMSGVHVNPDYLEPIGPVEYSKALRDRDEVFRIRMIQQMVFCALILDPLPPYIVERISRYAYELSVDEDMLRVAQEQMQGARNLIGSDFLRSGYSDVAGVSEVDSTSKADLNDQRWAAVEDPALAAKWASLEDLGPSTLGRKVWEFYRSRGFQHPGEPGSASPYLAQHDWVHIIADYGSTVESEIEVFGLIARANDDPGGFSLLVMVLSLFETGMLSQVAIFNEAAGHLSRNTRRMGVRMADAMYRGAIVGAKFGGRDLMEVDWFEFADHDLFDVRRMVGMPPKSEPSCRAGSVGPSSPGGITEFQLGLGMSMAESMGVEYNSFGATLAPDRLPPTGTA